MSHILTCGLTISLFLLGACGGSGSSGFDASVNSEQMAIAKVSEEGGCEALSDGFICAPGANAPESASSDSGLAGMPSGSSTPSTTLSMEPTSNGLLFCQEGSALSSGTCTFLTQITTQNFEAQTQFFVLVRQGTRSTWSMRFESEASSSDPTIFETQVVLELDGSLASDAAEIQIAVLVFQPSTAPLEPNLGLSLLLDYGADFIYVSSGLSP